MQRGPLTCKEARVLAPGFRLPDGVNFDGQPLTNRLWTTNTYGKPKAFGLVICQDGGHTPTLFVCSNIVLFGHFAGI